MKLLPHDLHLCFSEAEERLLGWDASHAKVLDVPARNRTVNAGEGHWGHCPPGEFLLGVPSPRHAPAFGEWFIPILDYKGHHAMRDFHREGIGLHGGGSGLPDPYAPEQGFVITEGCVRLQNRDLALLVERVLKAHEQGGLGYLTVAA
jgi:hypothetical protein